MFKIKAVILALRIEYHWWYIKLYRQIFDVLFDAGEALSSKRVQTLNRCISRHITRVTVLNRYYKEHYSGAIGGVL